MWTQFAPEGGVAIVSRYSRLKAVMEPITFRPHLGLVRYGSGDITTWNTIRFISTKRARYAHEREVRAMLWPEPPPNDGVNRHIDINNIPRPEPVYGTLMPYGYRPHVDLRRLITDIIVSPYAPPERIAEVQALIQAKGYSFPVRASSLHQERVVLPTARELDRYR